MNNSVPDIKQTVEDYHRPMVDDPHHRYLSWDHCYSYFQTLSSSPTDREIDLGALHLAFYLASWGMYRGSTFLLQKDYRVHIPIIRLLFEKSFASLWNCSNIEVFDDQCADLIVELSESITANYREIIKSVDGTPRDVTASDTLTTKIMLGTLGCVPAYDRYVYSGLSRLGLKPYIFGRNGLRRLFTYCREHSSELQSIVIMTQSGKLRYPPMKLMDMYLWRLGFDPIDMPSTV